VLVSAARAEKYVPKAETQAENQVLAAAARA